MLFTKNTNYLYIPIISIILLLLIYYIQKSDKKSEQFDKICRNNKCDDVTKCVKPTKDNPLMNVLLTDYQNDPNRAEACINTDKTIMKNIDDNFYFNVFKDTDDLYQKGYSQRQFYTTPSTTIPNDQGSFAHWLYKMPETCKENQTNCLKYEDIRYVRYNPDIDKLEKIIETN
jgi:hypothetical protein